MGERTLKATSPTMIPKAKNIKATTSQMKPHTKEYQNMKIRFESLNTPLEGQHPQILANSEASDVFTFLASVSSGLRKRIGKGQ